MQARDLHDSALILYYFVLFYQNETEGLMMEINIVLSDLMIFIRDFDDFVKPQPIKRTILTLMDDVYTKPEPYGLVLIYGAWNYPFALVAQPLIGAIAAGKSNKSKKAQS